MRIDIVGLGKVYRTVTTSVTALSGIDLEIGEGMFGLLGPNGAGKTTLMRILSGIARPSTGTVRVGGYDLATESGRLSVKAMLGYLPQELGLYPELTARQFLDYMGILKHIADARSRRRQVAAVLDATGLTDVADRTIKGFSGGMKRRVGIAQALLGDPRVIIVDEPTAGLDPEERVRFRNLLVDLARGRIVLLSTHIVEDIGQTCRQMAVLDGGRLRFSGSPAELMARADGQVWQVRTSVDEKPGAGVIVVSTRHLADGVEYRVVGPRPRPAHAPSIDSPRTGSPLIDSRSDCDAKVAPVQPSLEDGYLWLMQGGA